MSKSCNFEKRIQSESSTKISSFKSSGSKWSTILLFRTKICQKATKATAIRKKGLDRRAAKKSALVKLKKNKVDKWFGTFVLVFNMPNGKVDEGEIALSQLSMLY